MPAVCPHQPIILCGSVQGAPLPPFPSLVLPSPAPLKASYGSFPFHLLEASTLSPSLSPAPKHQAQVSEKKSFPMNLNKPHHLPGRLYLFFMCGGACVLCAPRLTAQRPKFRNALQPTTTTNQPEHPPPPAPYTHQHQHRHNRRRHTVDAAPQKPFRASPLRSVATPDVSLRSDVACSPVTKGGFEPSAGGQVFPRIVYSLQTPPRTRRPAATPCPSRPRQPRHASLLRALLAL